MVVERFQAVFFLQVVRDARHLEAGNNSNVRFNVVKPRGADVVVVAMWTQAEVVGVDTVADSVVHFDDAVSEIPNVQVSRIMAIYRPTTPAPTMQTPRGGNILLLGAWNYLCFYLSDFSSRALIFRCWLSFVSFMREFLQPCG